MTKVIKNPNTVNGQSVASSASVTPSVLNDLVDITGLAVNLTLNNPVGAPFNGQVVIIRIKDNGTSRTINYGVDYRAIGIILPTATTISKITYICCVYNANDTKWDCTNTVTQL